MPEMTIIQLITAYAAIMHFDPNVAVAVAQHESNLNPNAVGITHREVGLFQIRPEFTPQFSREQLFDIHTNIIVGITKLKEAKRLCPHRNELDWLVCYNAGVKGGSRIRFPHKFPYVTDVSANVRSLKMTRTLASKHNEI